MNFIYMYLSIHVLCAVLGLFVIGIWDTKLWTLLLLYRYNLNKLSYLWEEQKKEYLIKVN